MPQFIIWPVYMYMLAVIDFETWHTCIYMYMYICVPYVFKDFCALTFNIFHSQDSGMVCIELHLCNSTLPSRPHLKKPTSRVPRATPCDLCQTVISIIKPILDSSDDESKAKAKAEAVCGIFPGNISDEVSISYISDISGNISDEVSYLYFIAFNIFLLCLNFVEQLLMVKTIMIHVFVFLHTCVSKTWISSFTCELPTNMCVRVW